MKALFFLLPLFSSVLALPQDKKGDDCEANCPLVNCVTDDAVALCECINNRESLCKEICPTYKPNYQRCPLELAHVRAAEPDLAICECEEVICPQVWPESCHCANDAKKACFARCGRPVPPLNVCIAHNVAARSPEPVPAPAPAPCSCPDIQCPQSWPESCYCERDAKRACANQCGGAFPIEDNCPPRYITARAPEPAPTPSCVCEDVVCIQSWPESCFCANDAKRGCFEKCGGEEPEYGTCVLPDVGDGALIADVAPAPEPTEDCKCTKILCAQVVSESCYCANYADDLCYQKCGGEKPVSRNCSALIPPGATPSLTTIFLPSPSSTSTPPLKPRQSSPPQNQICGGGRGMPHAPCPAGQVCIADLFQPGSCGPACDQPGICAEDKLCGGFGGFECEVEG